MLACQASAQCVGKKTPSTPMRLSSQSLSASWNGMDRGNTVCSSFTDPICIHPVRYISCRNQGNGASISLRSHSGHRPLVFRFLIWAKFVRSLKNARRGRVGGQMMKFQCPDGGTTMCTVRQIINLSRNISCILRNMHIFFFVSHTRNRS